MGARARVRAALADERGQSLPVLVVFTAALLAFGFALFQVGRASVIRADAQTAADAAALAAANEIAGSLPALGLADPTLADDAAAEDAAREYAERNGAELVSYDRVGFDVRVVVRSQEELDEDARELGAEGEAARARAQAHVEPLIALGGGVPVGDVSGEVSDAIALGARFGLVVSSYLRPGDFDSLHSTGRAVDLAGPPAGMAGFYRAALQRYSYLEELFYDPLGGIDQNVQIGPIGDHSDHVHIAFPPGGGEPGGRPPIRDEDLDAGGANAGDLPDLDDLGPGGSEVTLVPYEG